MPQPTLHSFISMLGGLLLVIGFFLPWLTPVDRSSNIPFRALGIDLFDAFPELSLAFVLGLLVLVFVFVQLAMESSLKPMENSARPVRILCAIIYVVIFLIMIEVPMRAESFFDLVEFGWTVSLFGSILGLISGMWVMVSLAFKDILPPVTSDPRPE